MDTTRYHQFHDPVLAVLDRFHAPLTLDEPRLETERRTWILRCLADHVLIALEEDRDPTPLAGLPADAPGGPVDVRDYDAVSTLHDLAEDAHAELASVRTRSATGRAPDDVGRVRTALRPLTVDGSRQAGRCRPCS